VAIKGYHQSSPRRHVNKLVLFSDSMFGVSNVGGRILTKTGHDSDGSLFFSYGGGTGRDVMTMVESMIVNNNDPYKGWIHGFWHGQNNLNPYGANFSDAANVQAKETTLRLAELVGARDRRFFFMSVIGSRQSATWNGTRLVYPVQENAFAGTQAIYEYEQWLLSMFPGQSINTRQALLNAAASSTLPDPTYPGMTEAQVASTYGVLPFSFHNGVTSLPVAQSSLNYTGTWSTDDMPTGGTANDYKIRIAGGTGARYIGNLIINVAGTWQEPAYDTVHMSPAGAEALSIAVAALINNSNW
jgi:hypothetical protein